MIRLYLLTPCSERSSSGEIEIVRSIDDLGRKHETDINQFRDEYATRKLESCTRDAAVLEQLSGLHQDFVALQRRLICDPSCLRSVSNVTVQQNRGQASMVRRQRRQPLVQSCTCESNAQQNQFPRQGIYFSWAIERSLCCPVHRKSSERRGSVQLSFRTHLLRGAISISLQIKTGAGGCSISPNLRFVTLVTCDVGCLPIIHKAFIEVVEQYTTYGLVNPGISGRTISQLKQLLRDGKGSLWDFYSQQGFDDPWKFNGRYNTPRVSLFDVRKLFLVFRGCNITRANKRQVPCSLLLRGSGPHGHHLSPTD